MRTSTSERSGRQGEFTPPAVRRIGPTARPFPTAAPSRGRVVALALLTLLATATAATSPLTAQTETEGIEASAPTDEAIRDALVRRLRAVEGLDGIEVAVEAGVVRLTGEVLSPTLREEAVSLAEATEGTVRVVDEVELIRDPREVLGPVLEELTDRARTFLAWLPLLGVALVIVLLFTLLAAWAGRRDWPYSKLSTNRFVQDLLRQVARSILFLTGALIALELLDATALVGAVLGAAGVAGLAIGFAFRNVVENFIASALLSVRQPFLPNDHVVIDGHEGKVLRLTSRATVLLTLDGNHLRIPNATVFNAVLLNYTRNPRRRLEVVVGIGTDEDLVFAQRLGVETLSEIDGVLADPPPTSRIFSWFVGQFARPDAPPRGPRAPARRPPTNRRSRASAPGRRGA